MEKKIKKKEVNLKEKKVKKKRKIQEKTLFLITFIKILIIISKNQQNKT
jgi:hypothetical protein